MMLTATAEQEKKQIKHAQAGFTLFEIIIVVAIIGGLMAIFLLMY